jgi:hypothetical protein
MSDQAAPARNDGESDQPGPGADEIASLLDAASKEVGTTTENGTVGSMKALFAQKALYSSSPVLPPATVPTPPARAGVAGRPKARTIERHIPDYIHNTRVKSDSWTNLTPPE